MNQTLSQFKILKKLGRGSYGDVVLARAPDQTYVAIKIISKKIISKQSFMEQYLKSEKEAMMSFKSRYIVELLDFLEDKDNIYFICEYCEGGDLYNFLAKQKDKVFTLEMTIKIMSQVINGLLLLHEKGYLHRDIKPQNILIKKDQNGNNQFKLCDFGFSKKIEKVKGSIVGTEPFMSPEIFENESYGFEADVWAFGVCMYFLLNMSYPFSINPHFSNSEKVIQMRKLAKNFSYRKQVNKTTKRRIQNCTEETEHFFRSIFHPNAKQRITFFQIIVHPVFKNELFVKDKFASKIIYKKEGEDSKDRLDKFILWKNEQIRNKEIDEISENDGSDEENINIPGTVVLWPSKKMHKNYCFEKQKDILQFEIDKARFLFEAQEDLVTNKKMQFVDFSDILIFRYNTLKYQMIILNKFFKELTPENFKQKYPGLKWDLFFLKSDFQEKKTDLENFRNSISVKVSEQFEKCTAQLNNSNPSYKFIQSILEPEITQTEFEGEFKKCYRQSTSKLYEISRKKFTEEIKKCKERKKIGNKITYLLLMVVICHSYNHILCQSEDALFILFQEYSKTLMEKGRFDFIGMRNWMIQAQHQSIKETIMQILLRYFVVDKKKNLLE